MCENFPGSPLVTTTGNDSMCCPRNHPQHQGGHGPNCEEELHISVTHITGWGRGGGQNYIKTLGPMLESHRRFLGGSEISDAQGVSQRGGERI